MLQFRMINSQWARILASEVKFASLCPSVAKGLPTCDDIVRLSVFSKLQRLDLRDLPGSLQVST